MSEPTYFPIPCALHDELQLLVLRGRIVSLTWRQADGAVASRSARLLDVYTRGSAEWALLDDSTEVRLDRLVEVDGAPFLADC